MIVVNTLRKLLITKRGVHYEIFYAEKSRGGVK